jgi:signal transduction histidine kinase
MMQQAVDGIMYGVLLTLAVYNLVLFFNLRDNSYLYYVLFFGTMLIGIMALDGFAAQYLWPNQGSFAAIAARLFMIISFNFGLLFAISYLRTKEYTPRLNTVMISLAIMVFIFLGIQFLLFRETAIIHVFLIIASSTSMLLAGVVVWRKGYRPARYYLIGWSTVLVGLIIFILTLVDVFPVTTLTDSILRIGLIVLAVILSIGLAERINVFRQERDSAIADERNRLARDLHDSVTQSIYSASLMSEVLPGMWQRDPDQAEAGLGELRHLTRGALAEMRTMLLELRPETLVKTPLGDLLEQLVEALASRMEIETQADIQPIPELPSDVHINYYRIAQEALNNVIKHSNASQARVHLATSPPYLAPQEDGWYGKIELSITDNGNGFDPGKAPPRSLGIDIMNERAAEIDGTLRIDSTPEEGTEVRLVWERRKS